MIDKTILDKIKKLFALTQSPNENEAFAASQMAMKLLHKYQLSVEEFQGLQEQTENELTIENLDEKFYLWKSQLFGVVAYNCFCLSFKDTSANKKKVLKLVGTPANRSMASAMYRYLVEVIERLTVEGLKEHSPNCGPGTAEVWMNSFRSGILIRLKERLDAQRCELNNENSIVRYDPYEQEKERIYSYLRSQGLSLRSSNDKSYQNQNARSAGYDAGGNINLNPARSLN